MNHSFKKKNHTYVSIFMSKGFFSLYVEVFERSLPHREYRKKFPDKRAPFLPWELHQAVERHDYQQLQTEGE
jgi:hypothetical protein